MSLIKEFKLSLWKILDVSRALVFGKNPEKTIVFYTGKADLKKIGLKLAEIQRRLHFFDSTINIVTINKVSVADYLNYKLLVILDGSDAPAILKLKKNEVFNLDFESNYTDGWDYHYLITKLYPEVYQAGIQHGRAKLQQLKHTLAKSFSKAYIFGTGPSLEKAIDNNFDDGIKIVSNTIVKDEELWLHLNPHFIVAGDAIYHFGISKFAAKFRRDLKLRLKQTSTHFVYPAQYHPFCLKEFADFKDRLIPIPIGSNDIIHNDLSIDYTLPVHGNVLLLLLLPLAATMAKTIGLWGFDGRSPTDKLFWKNSSKHFYTDDVDELKQLHPLFFEQLVPKNAPDSYVKRVHGDLLDNALSIAERAGFEYQMLHPSYTETLSKRYHPKTTNGS